MKLPQDVAQRLIEWAQNEEMVDQHYTAHGKDCLAAAAALAAPAADIPQDVARLIREAEQAALPDPYDEREVMCAPLLRKLAAALAAIAKERNYAYDQGYKRGKESAFPALTAERDCAISERDEARKLLAKLREKS